MWKLTAITAVFFSQQIFTFYHTEWSDFDKHILQDTSWWAKFYLRRPRLEATQKEIKFLNPMTNTNETKRRSEDLGRESCSLPTPTWVKQINQVRRLTDFQNTAEIPRKDQPFVLAEGQKTAIRLSKNISLICHKIKQKLKQFNTSTRAADQPHALDYHEASRLTTPSGQPWPTRQ